MQWPTEIDSIPLYFSKSDWARLRGVSERTIEREMDAGTGAPFVRIGRRTLIAREAALAWLKSQEVASAAEARVRERDRRSAVA